MLPVVQGWTLVALAEQIFLMRGYRVEPALLFIIEYHLYDTGVGDNLDADNARNVRGISPYERG